MSEVPQDWIHEPPDTTIGLECEFASVDEAIHAIRITQVFMGYLHNWEIDSRYATMRERAKAARLWLLDLEAKA